MVPCPPSLPVNIPFEMYSVCHLVPYHLLSLVIYGRRAPDALRCSVLIAHVQTPAQYNLAAPCRHRNKERIDDNPFPLRTPFSPSPPPLSPFPFPFPRLPNARSSQSIHELTPFPTNTPARLATSKSTPSPLLSPAHTSSLPIHTCSHPSLSNHILTSSDHLCACGSLPPLDVLPGTGGSFFGFSGSVTTYTLFNSG